MFRARTRWKPAGSAARRLKRSGFRRERRWPVAAIVVAAVAVLSGCGSSSADGGGSASADGAYPLTVQGRYGPVTIDKAPERAVALSPTSADELISVGVTPVAVAADPATLEASYPWMSDSIKDISDAKLMSPSGELNLEAIAQTTPDLIVAATWQVTDKAIYDKLSQIAPTVTPDSDALNVDWNERLLATAAAVDKTDEAKQIIADIGKEYAAVGDKVPDISSKTYQWVRADPDGFGFGNGSVLGLFGLKPAANQDNTQNGPKLSKENTAQLDADVLGIWIPTKELADGLAKDPLFQALPAVKRGTIFYADFPVAYAANTPAPMALRWLKSKLAPTIEKLG